MELIDTLDELIENTFLLEKMLHSDSQVESAKAKDLIKKGMCFIKYENEKGVFFAPSRFIGYKENTILKHIDNQPSGSITTARIIKILGQEAKANKSVEKDYESFCKSHDIKPNQKGNFGNERKFWDFDTLETNVYGDIELSEGRKKYVKHLLRERNPRIRQITISNFLAKHKRLYCEACLFDFEKKYGETGKGFIECHHTVPVSKMADGHKTKPEDIVLLCSNCHRIVHKGKDWLTIKQLKAIIKIKQN